MNPNTENTVEELLEDRKLTLEDTKSFSDGFERLMRFFAQEDNQHLEQMKHNEEVYRNLGWESEPFFDVINSFWTIFVCALVDWSNSINDKSDFWKSLPEIRVCKICKEWPYSIFSFGKNTFLAYATNNGLSDIGKKTYAEKAINQKNLQSFVIQKFLNERGDIAKLIKELAELTHTVADFMPCPKGFNVAKYSAWIKQDGEKRQAFDFFPLMIDLIEKCYVMGEVEYEKSPLQYTIKKKDKTMHFSIKYNTIQYWHGYFSGTDKNAGDVRTKYCLENYYYIDIGSDNMQHIKGIPFFKKQRLEYPLPKETEEVKECLDEMVKRIKIRAYRLFKKANDHTS